MIIKMFEDMFSRIQSKAYAPESIEDLISRRMKSYFSENFAVEQEYLEKDKAGDREFFTVSIDKKVVIHHKYWSNSDEFYIPCSMSSDPKFDWERVKDIEILRSEDDKNTQYLFVYRYAKRFPDDQERKYAYVLKAIENNLMIEGHFY